MVQVRIEEVASKLLTQKELLEPIQPLCSQYLAIIWYVSFDINYLVSNDDDIEELRFHDLNELINFLKNY